MGTNSSDGSLYFDAGVNVEKLIADFERAKKAANDFVNSMEMQGKQLDSMFNKLSGAIAAYFSFEAASKFTQKMIAVRTEFQNTEIAFRTMLNSKEKADALFEKVVAYAAVTPFQLTDLAAATKQLLAFGFASETVMEDIEMLGNVAAGLNVPIGRLILNLGQVKNIGKLTGRDLRDFATAGVPLLGELAKNAGKSEAEISKMVSAGKIGFAEVRNAFKSMTAEGGKFHDLTGQMAKTLGGQISNLKDAVDRMLNSMGKANEGILSDGIKLAMDLVNNYDEVVRILKILVITYGSYKAAVIATMTIQRAMAMAELPNLIKGFQLLRGAILGTTAATTALQKAQLATAIGAAVAAIAALVSIAVIYTKKANESAKATNDFISSIEQEKKTINELFSTLKNNSASYDEKQRALKVINETYKEYLPNLLTEKSSLDEIDAAYKRVYESSLKALAVKANEELLKDSKEQVKKASEYTYSQVKKFMEAAEITGGGAQAIVISEIDAITKKLEQGAITLGDAKKQLYALAKKYGSDQSDKSSQEQYNFSGVINNVFAAMTKLTDAKKEDAEKTAQIMGFTKQFTEVATNNEQKVAKLAQSIANYDAQLSKISQTGEEAFTGEADMVTSLRDAAAKDLERLQKAMQILQDDTLTVPQKVLALDKEILEVEAEIAELRKGKATDANRKTIEAKEETVKTLKSDRDFWRGTTDKELKKDTDADAKRLKAAQDYEDKLFDLTIEARQRLADAEPVEEKKRAQLIQIEYDRQTKELERKRRERIELLNEKVGIKLGQPEFKNELPEKEQKEYEQQQADLKTWKIKQETDLGKEIVRLRRDTMTELRAVTQTSYEQEKEAINNYYDDWAANILEVTGDKDLAKQIGDARKKALEQLDIKTSIDSLDLAEKTEQQKYEIERKGIDNAEKIEIEKLKISRKFAIIKLELLRQLGLQENSVEIQNVKNAIESMNAVINDYNTKVGNKTTEVRQKNIKTLRAELKEYKALEAALKKAGKSKEEIEAVGIKIKETQTSIRQLNQEDIAALSQGFEYAAQVIGSMNEDLAGVANILGGIGQILAKNYVQGALSILNGIKVLVEQAERKREEARQKELDATQKMISDMEQAYARLESNLDRVFSSKRLQAFRDQLFYLGMDINSIVTNIQAKLKTDAKNLQKVQVEMIKTVWEFQNQSWVMESQGFTLEGISKAIEANIGIMSSLQNDARFKTDATLQELFKSYDNFVQKLYDLKDQMQQFITGTTQENIADSIVQGFIEGKKSMVDFTEDFKTLMQNAVVAAFKNRILNEKLDAFYNEFAKVAGDYDGLTAAEISTLQGVYSKIIEEAGVAYDYFQRISGVTLGSQNTEEDALTGRIKGITEEQADLLGGILLSMREYVMRMASYQGANGAAVNSQLVSIDTSSKLIYQELINMNQINMTDLIRHNRTIAENTSFNKILPDIKNELVNLNLYIKNL